MTVYELIQQLSRFPADREVRVVPLHLAVAPDPNLVAIIADEDDGYDIVGLG